MNNLIACMLNILLVVKKIRPATLIEGLNFTEKSRKKNLFRLFKFVQTSGLKMTIENEKLSRFLVGPEDVIKSYEDNKDNKNIDAFLGKLLGFYCYNHAYSDTNQTRILAQITLGRSIVLIAEMCEASKAFGLEKYYSELLKKVNRVFESVGLNKTQLSFTKITPISLRIEALEKKDLAFIQSKMDDYIMDLDNYWAPGSYLAKRFLSLTSHTDLLLFIWKNFVQEDITMNLPYSGEQVNKLMTKFDEKLFKGKSIPDIPFIVQEWNDDFGEYIKLKL